MKKSTQELAKLAAADLELEDDEAPIAPNLSATLKANIEDTNLMTKKADTPKKTTTRKRTTKKATPKASDAKKTTKKRAPRKSAPKKAAPKKQNAADQASEPTPAEAPVVADVSTRAMLVDLRISRWQGYKRSQEIAHDISEQHEAEENATRVDKKLVSKQFLSKLRSTVNRARRYYRAETLPWSDDGPRVLIVARYERFRNKMNEFVDEYNTDLEAMLDEYDAELKRRKKKATGLGELFDIADYPTKDQLRARHGFRYRIQPLPSAADFRASLAAEDLERVKEEIANDLQEQFEIANQSLLARVNKYVARIVERLSADKVIVTDALIEDAQALLEEIPELNFTDDARIAKALDAIKPLADVEVEYLRHSKKEKTRVLEEAKEVMADLSAFLA